MSKITFNHQNSIKWGFFSIQPPPMGCILQFEVRSIKPSNGTRDLLFFLNIPYLTILNSLEVSKITFNHQNNKKMHFFLYNLPLVGVLYYLTCFLLHFFRFFFFKFWQTLSVDSVSRTKLAQLGSSRCSVVMPEDPKGVKLGDLAPALVWSFGLPSDHGLITRWSWVLVSSEPLSVGISGRLGIQYVKVCVKYDILIA